MSGDAQHTDSAKKHRHDVGSPDHGPASTERTTRAIQVLLGACIIGTALVLAYAVAVVGLQ